MEKDSLDLLSVLPAIVVLNSLCSPQVETRVVAYYRFHFALSRRSSHTAFVPSVSFSVHAARSFLLGPPLDQQGKYRARSIGLFQKRLRAHAPLPTSAVLPLESEEPTLPTLLLVGRALPSSNLLQLCAGRSWKRGVLFQEDPNRTSPYL